MFAVRDFRALWSAQLVSSVGDQVAQVAIAALVYAKTGSAFLTAVAYALTYLPPVVGRPLLGGLADALPRRQVLLTLDLVRAGLVEMMALPQVPLPWVCTLLFAVMMLSPAVTEARSGLLRQIMPRDCLPRSSTLGIISSQASQAAGFLAGGALVALLGPHRSLALDALSFCLSASFVACWVRPRPHGKRDGNPDPSLPALAREGGAIIFKRPALRTLVLVSWLAGFAVVPEGLAAPYAHTLGGGPLVIGLLMACMPAGMVTGAAVIGRLARPDEQSHMIGWLAMLSCAPLVASLAHPPLWVVVPLWALAGAGGAYQLTVVRAVVSMLGPADHDRAFATAQTGLLAAQGLGILLAGAAASRLGVQAAVAFAGLIGVTLAAVLASDWARYRATLPTD